MRSFWLRAALVAAPAALTLLLPASALAGPLTLGAGVFGEVGGNFLGKPSDQTVTYSNGVTGPDATYPGFGGVGAGFGLMLDARLFDLAGVEVDIYHSTDRGHGDLTINNQTFTIDIGQGAWHLPVLAKLSIPLGILRPLVLLGPEFVFPNKSEAKVTPAGLLTQISATANSYTLFTFGLGAELKLPLPVIDLRIPFTVRGSYNPGTSSKADDREKLTTSGTTITAIQYRSEWQYQVMATLGASIHF